jgi:uncharacterized membrane protein
MQEKQRTIKYWVFKVLSIIVSCGLPIYAVWEHFPIWTVTHGKARSLGVGGILCLIVLLIIFRKAVFNFLRDRAKLHHAPPVVVWLVMLIISYILLYISHFIQDLTTVFWMGLVGCAIGTMLTYIAENKYGKKKEETDGGA